MKNVFTKALILALVPTLLASCSSGKSSSSVLIPDPTTTPISSDSDPSSSDPASSTNTGSSDSSASSSQSSSSSSSSSSSQSTGTQTSVSSDPSSSLSSTSSTSIPELPEIDYVKVFAPTIYTHIWAWTDEKVNLFASWPGVPMKEYDENWKTYDFENYSSINLIFSYDDGKTQTDDLKVEKPGYWWFYNNQWYNQDPIAYPVDPGPEVPVPTGEGVDLVSEAATYMDFPVWKEYDANHWKIESPYTGSRKDFRDESIYFAMTTRFYDGDKSNNVRCWDGRNNSDQDPAWRGDFKGLIEKMDYIKALGFTSIWITPVVQNASGYDYHGYHAVDFTKVDGRYKSEDVDFIDVIKAAHARDMKIILDVVFNHTGNFGETNLYPMFYKNEPDYSIKGMIQKEKSLLPSNYASLNGDRQYVSRVDSMKNTSSENANGHDNNHIYHHGKDMSWEQYSEQTGQIAGDCVDLNTENPTVANYLVKCYGEFIRMGVDAFRIDTMKHISRLTFNKYLFPAFQHYADLCGNPNFFMFGEVCARVREVWNKGQACDSAPFYTWKESKDYAWGTREVNEQSTLKNWNDNTNTNQPSTNNAYLSNMAYHTPDHSRWTGTSVIDFPMHWNFQYARDAYNVAVNNDKYYNDATYNVVYVDSHDYGPDGIQDIRYNMGTNAWKENMSLMFTFRGVPCIYYGSEIEFQKGKLIDKGAELALAESGRAYYGDNLEGSVTASDFGVYNASGTVSTTLGKTLSKHLQMLNKIRLKVPALRRGQYKSFGDLKFVRRYTESGKDSVAAVAISGGCTFTGLPNGSYVDLVSGNRVNVSGGTLSANVSGQGNLAVYVLDNGVSGTLGKIS